MPVRVYLVDDEPVTYPAADAAALVEGTIRLTQWDSQLHKQDEVATLDAKTVTRAEVLKNGKVTDIVAGTGKKTPA